MTRNLRFSVRDLLALGAGAALTLAAAELVPTARAADDFQQRQAAALERGANAAERAAKAQEETAREIGRLVRATERCGGR